MATLSGWSLVEAKAARTVERRAALLVVVKVDLRDAHVVAVMVGRWVAVKVG